MKRIIIIFLSLFLFFALANSAEAVLNCSFNSSSCPGGYTPVLKMSASSNAHAEFPGRTNFTNYICCSGISGISSGTVFLKLSALTNAHVGQTNYSNFTNNAYLTPLTNETISCSYRDSCFAGEACLASITGVTNAHIGECSAHSIKVCCSVSTSEQFQFNLALNPNSGTATQGKQASTTVQVTRVAGTVPAENVSFWISEAELPLGVTKNFSPSSCLPNDSCSSILTFSVGASVTPGTYSINVCGTASGGFTAPCKSYTLIVTEAGTQVYQPTVTVEAATNIDTTSARLNGDLVDMGNADFCLVWFEWGKTTGLGASTTVQNMTSPGLFYHDISGLEQGTTYYFKAFAKNGGSW